MSPSLNILFGKQINFFYHGKEFDDEQFKLFVNKHEHADYDVVGGGSNSKKPKPVNVRFVLNPQFVNVLKKSKNPIVDQFVKWLHNSYDLDVIIVEE
jgi:hypothetical protein